MKVKDFIKELQQYNQEAEVILWSWNYEEDYSCFQNIMFGATQSYPKAVLLAGNKYAHYSQEEMAKKFR